MQNKKNSKKYVEMLNIIFFRRLGRFEKELKVEWSEELMITKEMIKKGFETGKVSVETEMQIVYGSVVESKIMLFILREMIRI